MTTVLSGTACLKNFRVSSSTYPACLENANRSNLPMAAPLSRAYARLAMKDCALLPDVSSAETGRSARPGQLLEQPVRLEPRPPQAAGQAVLGLLPGGDGLPEAGPPLAGHGERPAAAEALPADGDQALALQGPDVAGQGGPVHP